MRVELTEHSECTQCNGQQSTRADHDRRSISRFAAGQTAVAHVAVTHVAMLEVSATSVVAQVGVLGTFVDVLAPPVTLDQTLAFRTSDK